MKQSHHFSKFYIIESLGVGEAPTGEILYKLIESQINENNLAVTVVFKRCVSKAEFFCVLQEAHDDANLRNEYPWIHIESHGTVSGNGIVLSSHDLIKWEELKPIFTEINLATKCNLMLVMSACNGAFLGEILQPTERAPCWGIIGPTQQAYPDDLMASFRSFYIEILSSLNGDKALLNGDKALRSLFNQTSSRNVNFLFLMAPDIFKKVYKGYIQEYCTDKEYWIRAKNLRTQLPSKTTQDIVVELKRQEPTSFEKYKNNFFMCDLFPENSARFQIEYNEVLNNS